MRGFSATAMNLSSGNDTLSFGRLPPNVLDSFIPGYSVISRFLLESFGFDIGILVSIGLLSMAAITSSRYAYNLAWVSFRRYCTSSVYIEQCDDIFVDLMKWISEQKVPHNARNVKAVTPWGHADDEVYDSDDEDSPAGTASAKSPTEIPLFNFSMWEIRIPLRFEPYLGKHHFWHLGKLFLVDRYRETRSSRDDSNVRDEEVVALACVGRSTGPIKRLLEEVRVQALQRQETLTTIRRPCSKIERRWASNPWQKTAVRPSRPIQTVVLDMEQKIKILTDINEYLHPSTRLWYAARGIPYRRGYLFHGAPGTGKTSLSFALAGIFGLDIFVISLQEPTLSEEDLNSLFNNLPSRCIVLLEDIDSAGIKRVDEDDEDSKPADGTADKNKDKNKTKDPSKNDDDTKEETKKAEKDWSIIDVAKALQGVNRRERMQRKQEQGISLSGLLNAIDGVASQEGRILVMTTNHPEKMDEALIRPGRVDMQVAFSLASREQVREMFVRMYVTDNHFTQHSRRKKSTDSTSPQLNEKHHPDEAAPLLRHRSAGLTKSALSIHQACAPPSPGTTRCVIMPLEELLTIADAFVARVPENTFSPAEIQGFLLTRKSEPRRALNEVQAWVHKQMLAKGIADTDGAAGEDGVDGDGEGKTDVPDGIRSAGESSTGNSEMVIVEAVGDAAMP